MSNAQQIQTPMNPVYYRMAPLDPQNGIVAGSRDIGVGKNTLTLKQGVWYQGIFTDSERAYLEGQRQIVESPNSKPLLQFYQSREEVNRVARQEYEAKLRKLQNLPPEESASPFAAPSAPRFEFDASRMQPLDNGGRVPAQVAPTTFDPLKDHQEALDTADAIDAQGVATIVSAGVGKSPQSGNIGLK